MRWFSLCLALCAVLGAQAPLHVVAVERRGPPPYEPGDRIYCLDGAQEQGLHVGDRLIVKRAGDLRTLGYAYVTGLRGAQAETRFEPKEALYPMKGDLAFPALPTWVPKARALNVDPIPAAPAPMMTSAAPPREGILYFLPQQGELSPAGVKKLEAWVKAWGRAGRWAVQVPSDKATPALQKQRAESLQAALRALGVAQAAVEAEPRSADSKFDPTWIRHWD
ncbi:hypothetical protein GETHLI_16490 [Geothrix limicola]|uniref:Uncharacterized protein n=1 Tax=Geothrix limicola TaxID=2927978 RepID=A0ABQ5QE77_9BACT|nr:hypothetical protein [Geothrix limicola]GLH73147.1 hypothetical protein GETHLI_16490 [Geothrix limicola]